MLLLMLALQVTQIWCKKLCSDNSFPISVQLAAGDALEAKFAALATVGVDDELINMKKRIAEGKQ